MGTLTLAVIILVVLIIVIVSIEVMRTKGDELSRMLEDFEEEEMILEEDSELEYFEGEKALDEEDDSRSEYERIIEEDESKSDNGQRMDWEEIATNIVGLDGRSVDRSVRLFRAKVFGGWLVTMHHYGSDWSNPVMFYPDLEHKWNTHEDEIEKDGE